MRKRKNRKIFFFILLAIVSFFCVLIYYLCNDPNAYGLKTVGIYVTNVYSSDVKNIELIKDLTLKLDENGTYEFSKKLPFIDQTGKWIIDEKGLVVNILLINGNGGKDKISVCCDDNGEITFYCYLDKSGNYSRIIFSKQLNSK